MNLKTNTIYHKLQLKTNKSLYLFLKRDSASSMASSGSFRRMQGKKPFLVPYFFHTGLENSIASLNVVSTAACLVFAAELQRSRKRTMKWLSCSLCICCETISGAAPDQQPSSPGSSCGNEARAFRAASSLLLNVLFLLLFFTFYFYL